VYYELNSDEANMSAYVSDVRSTGKSLISGNPITVRPETLPFQYSFSDSSGAPLFDYYSALNIMSAKLTETLERAGVDNLQKFACELSPDGGGPVRSDFFTVNILGLVSCADVAASKTTELGSSFYFHNLVLRAEKTGDLLMFRLAESEMTVIVHESVAAAIKGAKLNGIVLKPLKQSASGKV
jgi:hypothetical protein